MSDGGSPNLLNLRDFRIQKKTSLSHTPAPKSSQEASSDTSPDFKVKRKLVPIQESDSDCDTSKTTEFDCDIVEEKGKKASSVSAEMSSNEIIEIIEILDDESEDSCNYRKPKSEETKERERVLQTVMGMFENVTLNDLHDAVTKSCFNVEAAIEIIKQMNKYKLRRKVEIIEESVNKKKDAPKVAVPFTIQSSTQKQNVGKRRMSMADVSYTTKKKVKRLRSEAGATDDSDDNGDIKEYKDNRVYDSDDDSDAEVNNDLTGDKIKVFKFFQTASLNELQLMSFCSKKKAETLIESRPFENWVELVKKLSNRHLGTDLLNAAQQVLITRHNIKHLMKKCRNLAGQLQRAVSASAGIKEQPALLNKSKKLENHQMIGLNWLLVLHAQGVNGILADEMGLGKTVQVIAFLARLKEIGATRGMPHLIVVPSSTLDNWHKEFKEWCPALNVFLYYGSIEERRAYRIEYWGKGNINNYDVILTTYTMVTNTSEERKMFKVTPVHYVIFDEAHMLKNMNTQRYEHLTRINGMNRILLTGTPLQNNLLELMSLLIFVMPKMFAGKTEDLKSLFSKTKARQESEDDLPAFERDQIKHAKDIMQPFVLRRLKKDCLTLMPKTTEVVKIPLAPTQLEQYEDLVYHFQNIGNTLSTKGFSAMRMMSELRKLSNHPLLLKYYYQFDDLTKISDLLAQDRTYRETDATNIFDDLECMSDFEIHLLCKQHSCLKKFLLPGNLILTSGKFLYLDKKLKQLKEGNHRVLIFSQYVIMLNVMEEYLQLRNYSYLRLDGTTPVTARQELIEQYTADPEIFIFLLSTKAGGLGINLTAADTVIIHDIDFNPYNDKQAEDRCHRFGQSKPVSIYRLVSKTKIEEGMWQINQEKLKLEKEVTTAEAENPDVKSVINLLQSVLGVDSKIASKIVASSTSTTPPAKP